jgi:hypothetical protein
VKLTHRQTAAVSALLDLCAEAGGRPIGYRAVAARLGVAPTTAYRMLRLAERLGYVRATYAPRAATRSVGRSPVLFEPSDLARRAVTPPPDETWEATRARLLEALASPDPAADREALRDILAGLTEPRTPLDLAGRTIAALMIGLEEAHGGAYESELLGRLARAGTRFGLSTLGGMLLGLAWANRATRAIAERLEREAERFQSALAELSPEQSSAIAAFVAQLDVTLRDRRRRQQAAGGPAER